jgi:hypothetical protein
MWLVASDLDSKVKCILTLKSGLQVTPELVQLLEGVECYRKLLGVR